MTSSFRKFRPSTPEKMKRSARRCNWRYSSWSGVWNCQTSNHVVESRLFNCLWSGCYQWLSDIELYHTNAFSTSYSIIKPRFNAEDIFVWNYHATFGHREATIFTLQVHGWHNLTVLKAIYHEASDRPVFPMESLDNGCTDALYQS
jgi:hypothetical protein